MTGPGAQSEVELGDVCRRRKVSRQARDSRPNLSLAVCLRDLEVCGSDLAAEEGPYEITCGVNSVIRKDRVTEHSKGSMGHA